MRTHKPSLPRGLTINRILSKLYRYTKSHSIPSPRHFPMYLTIIGLNYQLVANVDLICIHIVQRNPEWHYMIWQSSYRLWVVGLSHVRSYVYRHYSKTHIGLCCSILPLRIILPSSWQSEVRQSTPADCTTRHCHCSVRGGVLVITGVCKSHYLLK